MKVINNKTIEVSSTVEAPEFDNSKVSRSGYARLVRLLTNEPVPAQVSYTGKINLR